MRSIRGRDDLFTRATVHIGLRVMWMMRLDFYIHVPLALAMSVCIKKERTAIRLSIASGTCTCLGKSIQMDSPGFDSPEVRISFYSYFEIKFEFFFDSRM